MEDPQKRNNWKRVRILYNGNRRFRKARRRKGKTQGKKTKSARRGSGESALSSLFPPSSSPVVRCIVVHSAVCLARVVPRFRDRYSVCSFRYSRTPINTRNDFLPRGKEFRELIPLFQNAYHYTERLPLCGTALERHYLPRLPCTNLPKYRNRHSHVGKRWRTFLFRYPSPHRCVTCSLRHVTYDRLLSYVGLRGYWLSKNYDFFFRIRSHGSTSFWTRKRVVGNLWFPSDNAWYGHWCQVGGQVSLPLTLLSWKLFLPLDFFFATCLNLFKPWGGKSWTLETPMVRIFFFHL